MEEDGGCGFEEKRTLTLLEELEALGLEENKGLQVSTGPEAQDVANVQFPEGDAR